MLEVINNLTNLQHVVRSVCKIVLLALTRLKLSPGRIKLAILSIDKLKSSSISSSQNSNPGWLNLIHAELLVDFTQEQLDIINAAINFIELVYRERPKYEQNIIN